MAMLNSAPLLAGLLSHFRSARGDRFSAPPPSRRLRTASVIRRRGFTLVEMLVSLVCVILLMMAYTQLFAEVGARINDARGSIDMSNRLHTAEQKLRNDLAGLTVEMVPWTRPESGSGYFEIIEGPLSDPPPPLSGPAYRNNGDLNNFPFGDRDDVLMFTARSKGAPFTGKFWVDSNNNGLAEVSELQTVQSEVAEVVWFLAPGQQPNPANPVTSIATNPPTYTLHRRVFLVMPSYAGAPTTFTYTTGPSAAPHIPTLEFYTLYDIAARYENNRYVANTLGDLTKREWRYGHWYHKTDEKLGFPHPPQHNSILPFGGSPAGTLDYTATRVGEDVVLTNVLAFDVQVWDPTAPIYNTGTAPNLVAVAPGDPGFRQAAGPITSLNSPVSLGAYVDLNWGWAGTGNPVVNYGSVPTILSPITGTQIPMSPFYSGGHSKSRLNVGNPFVIPPPDYAIFDNWSFHYEHDGLNQDGKDKDNNVIDDLVDEGTDGFDNPFSGAANPNQNLSGASTYAGGVDDPDELETSPPYPVPLRGIKVRIRVYEPDTRQIREVSVVHSFVPE